jgi:hypothetical protein
VPTELGRDELRRLVRIGARVRLAEIERERTALAAIINGRPSSSRQRARETARGRRRPTWTAAQRRAVSERMKKYWAKRKRATQRRPKRATPD